MNLKNNKLIAREFMILISCFVIALFTFLSIYPYNYFKTEQIKPEARTRLMNHKVEVSENNSSLRKAQIEILSLPEGTFETVKKGLEADIAYRGYQYFNHTQDSIRIYKQLLSEHLISSNRQVHISRIAFLSCFIFLFLLRYFICAIIWSIKILKQ